MFSATVIMLLCGAVLVTETTAFPQLANNRITEVDGFIFDGPADRPSSVPLDDNGRSVVRSTMRLPATMNTTPSMASQNPQDTDSFESCTKACPVTSEYNPVCGSDNVQYRNPGSLTCASQCGKDVSVLRVGRCVGGNFRG